MQGLQTSLKMQPVSSKIQPSRSRPLSAVQSAVRPVHSMITAIESHKVAMARDPKWEKDDELLMSLGYKPEMKRTFSTLELFGVAFSIMSLVPSIASVFTDALTAGGIGMTWSWLIASAFVMSVGLSMSELASSQPTSGGLYYWTYELAPTKIRRPLSFLTGYANTLGLVGATCSINYGFAGLIMSLPTIASEGKFTSTKFEEYGVFVAVTIVHVIGVSLPTYMLAKFQTLCVFLNLLLVFLVCIAVPIGASNRGILNSGKYVFTDSTNQTDWQYGWSFLLSMMACIWTIGAFDSAVHTSEESQDAQDSAPKAIIMSIAMCGLLGWGVMAVLASAMPMNYSEIINSWTGQPMAAVLLRALGKKWTLGIVSLMVVAQFGMGLSIVLAASRQTYAFARDDALPFSRFVKIVVPKTGVPMFSGLFVGVVACLIGCLVMIDSTAALALFSLASSSNSLAWGIPIACKLIAPKGKWTPGPFYLGKFFSVANNIISCLYLTFVVFVLTMMPSTKHPNKDSMNYTCVINVTIWVGSLVALYTVKRDFTGPRPTLAVNEGSDPNSSQPDSGPEGSNTSVDKNDEKRRSLEFA